MPDFTILIADDNEINCLLLQEQLKEWTQHVDVAKDGREAWGHLQNRRYDLVFLDLQMPYYDGDELIKLLRLDSPNRDTPIIAVTAHAHRSQRRALIESGFDECLIKPVLMEQIKEIVDLWRPDSPIAATADEHYYADRLLQRTQRDRQLAFNLFKQFFSALPAQLANIEQSLQRRQWTESARTVHILNGSVSFCGFTDLQKLIDKLEDSLDKQDGEQVASLFTDLKRAIHSLLAMQNEILSRIGN